MKDSFIMNRKVIFLGLVLMAIISVPIIIYSQKQEEVRSRAAAATVLTFSPTSSVAQPIQKNVSDPLTLDVMLNPGTNAISILKLDIQYDPNKFLPGTNPIVINSAAFSTIVEGPVVDSNIGNIVVTLSVGTDPTKAIKTLTKIATINLIANSTTQGSGPTVVGFGPQSQALSVAVSDQSSQNVLATAMPDYIAIGPEAGPTINPGQTSPSPITLPTVSSAPGVTLDSGDTTFSYTIFLHGIGNSGDSTNPTGTSLSNKNPLHTQRELDIFVYNALGQQVANVTGSMTYDSVHGDFTGNTDLGTALPAGNYTVKVQSPSYLRKLIPGIQTISSLNSLTLPTVTLVAGDINGDNTLNIIDYNILLGCYSDILPAAFCPSQNQIAADLNDDGSINQFDYNLFLREIQVQNGD